MGLHTSNEDVAKQQDMASGQYVSETQGFGSPMRPVTRYEAVAEPQNMSGLVCAIIHHHELKQDSLQMSGLDI